MSLLSMPFVDTNIDTALSVFAGVVLIATIAAVGIGFWKIHELPIHKASTKEHHQIGLITALTWIGFVWHWVWVIAVIIAFVDGEQHCVVFVIFGMAIVCRQCQQNPSIQRINSMLEGLAVWALFIYLLRLVGMPWNKFTQSFAYIGGGSWLVFVWFGLITYAPMDLSGGSLVQSPHVQLRPALTTINGRVKAIYVEPNSQVTQGQLIYELEAEPYTIALNKALASLDSAKVARDMAEQNIAMAQASETAAVKDIDIATKQLSVADADYRLKNTMLARYVKQNSVVKHTVTASMLDEQRTAVAVAKSQQVMLNSQIEKHI